MRTLSFTVILSIFIGALLLQLDPAFAQEGTRNLDIVPKKATGEKNLLTLYEKRYGVVVGINRYPNARKLDAAVKDAKQVTAALKKMGFDEVITLVDEQATKSAIVDALGDTIGEKAQENDLIVFFFAGHGETKGKDTEQMGFILPYDYNPKKHMTTSVSMSTLHDISKGIKAKHMLYAMDSCFSGGILKARAGSAPAMTRGTYRYLKNLTENQAHVVITAGGQNEYALEEGGSGLFTRAFLDGLTGKADTGGKGFVTASALAQYIQETVQNYLPPGVRQNPQYGRLIGEGDVVLSMLRPLDIGPEESDRGKSAGTEVEEAIRAERARLQQEMKEFEERQARAKAEQDRQASIERERIRLEDERLNKENEERERQAAIERERLRLEKERFRKERERQAALEREELQRDKAEAEEARRRAEQGKRPASTSPPMVMP